MTLYSKEFDKLKELLDLEYSWPAEYVFKFIIKRSELNQITSLFQNEVIEFKESGSGKYVSLTLKKKMSSSEDVILIYKKASMIPGIISL